jgi:hypothetical protein
MRFLYNNKAKAKGKAKGKAKANAIGLGSNATTTKANLKTAEVLPQVAKQPIIATAPTWVVLICVCVIRVLIGKAIHGFF